MADLPELTALLRERQSLGDDAVRSAAAALASAEIPDAQKSDFLIALSDKGETAAEVAAFARAFRERAIDPGVAELAPQAIDIVGTGGDHAGGFNISSLVVLVLASLGVPVMKHGNRGITSKCGSADLLAGLGFRIDAPPETLRRALGQLGYVFFFAPSFHPAFKHIAPVRKALAAQGRRSVFNILGPMINPGRPANMLLGVFAEEWVPRLADVLDLLGTSSGLAVHGRIGEDRGIDEMTTATRNRVRGIGRLGTIDAVWTGEEHGFPLSPFDDLKGGDLTENLALTEAIVAGRGPIGLVDTIVFNAAAGLWICGKTATVREGVPAARDALIGGPVKARIAATREFFAGA